MHRAARIPVTKSPARSSMAAPRTRSAPHAAPGRRAAPVVPDLAQLRVEPGGVAMRASTGNDATTGQGKSDCQPGAGIPPTDCSAYMKNAWWLPLAYVNNATCACTETPDEPKANCIRKSLQDRMDGTPGWLKALAASQKMLESNPWTHSAYQAFVQATLTPRIYKDHVDAYKDCCCPSGPAPYPAWIGVTSVPLPCSAVGASIRQFGSCNGTPGQW